jgi:hypothetical protein
VCVRGAGSHTSSRRCPPHKQNLRDRGVPDLRGTFLLGTIWAPVPF